MEERPPYLKQEKYCISAKEAEIRLNSLLLEHGGLNNRIITDKRAKIITITNPLNEQRKFSYVELVNELRTCGVSLFYQNTIDNTDEVFGGSFSMSHTMPNTQNTIKWAGFEKSFNGISKISPSEIDIADDIEFYKYETCVESDEIDMVMVGRNYRGYLFSCIALVDSYINKHVILKTFKGADSEKFTKLKESRNVEERIELFVDLFCIFDFALLKSNRAWTDFKQLKTLRNDVVHSKSPYFGLEVKELAYNLNLSIHGIGSFLRFLQEGQGRKSLGFIEIIRNSKIIYYNEVTKRSNGKFHERKVDSNFNRNLNLSK